MSADQARVTMRVSASPERAFEAFTAEIERWWRRGPRFRNLPGDRGIIHMEAGVGGRLFESIRDDAGERLFEIGRILHWDPPHALTFSWRATNFAPDEVTQVDVSFTAQGAGTLVTLTHRGWSAIRADHPARHGAAAGPFLRDLGLWWSELARALAAVLSQR